MNWWDTPNGKMNAEAIAAHRAAYEHLSRLFETFGLFANSAGAVASVSSLGALWNSGWPMLGVVAALSMFCFGMLCGCVCLHYRRQRHLSTKDYIETLAEEIRSLTDDDAPSISRSRRPDWPKVRSLIQWEDVWNYLTWGCFGLGVLSALAVLWYAAATQAGISAPEPTQLVTMPMGILQIS